MSLFSSVLGLVHLIGLKTFLQVFQLRRKNTRKGYSIALAIDTTGSMSDDIRAVIRNSVNIVTSLQGTENEPERYVLTTFNDPGASRVLRFCFVSLFG
jgi:hypothetical protein